MTLCGQSRVVPLSAKRVDTKRLRRKLVEPKAERHVAKEKTWFLKSIRVSISEDLLQGIDPKLQTRSVPHLLEFLDQQNALGIFVEDEVYALRRRSPYDRIVIVPAGPSPQEPMITSDLFGMKLVVEIHAEASELLRCEREDRALISAFSGLIRQGLQRLKDVELAQAFERGLARCKDANFVAIEPSPLRDRVEGTKLISEVVYLLTPTQRLCEIALWKSGKPAQKYFKRFQRKYPQREGGICQMSDGPMVNGAVISGGHIFMAMRIRGTLLRNDLYADERIPIAEVEAVLGSLGD